MEKLTEATRAEILQSAGLSPILTAKASPTVPPKTAWNLVTNLDTQPTLVIDDSIEDYLDQVNQEWDRVARENELIADDGSFLISISGPGSFDLPWASVRATPQLQLAQKLISFPGQPEFVTMSNDSHVVCGVTSEENGIWIVVASTNEA
ncbi:hypothetical protein [Saccharopolyspora pogona]|uniref:hypothetical protein n=1 Tax=Saccharopolyspora pogona TaxID=333966 RepID=UPI001682BB91|nr:hypothetical protein [Saccharopolyspora pogona]